MCTGLEIAGLVGGLASTAGGLVTANEQQKNAERQAEARNNELKRTLLKNDDLAKQSRETFNERAEKLKGDQMAEDQQAATEKRTDTLEQAVEQTPVSPDDVSLSGSAPTVVKSELAKRMGDALAGSKAQAQAQAKLGGYGDSWMNQGFADVEAGRDLNQQANFASGNMSILPYQQDIAEMRATKPISPIGGLMQGLGGMLTSFGGSGGLTPKKRYTSPVGGYI